VTADALLAVLRDRHTSLILVTHDRQLAERCDAVVTIVDGRLRR
jgi:putative ABC transport system ATP-binding protein